MSRTRLPLLPPHRERICWGFDKDRPEDDLACGNGTIRTLHPCELFGDDWLAWFERNGEVPDDGMVAPALAGAAPAGKARR